MAKITLLTDFNCRICNREFKNSHALGRHLYLSHDIKSNDYTIKYLLNDVLPKCKCGCGKEMKIIKYSHYEYCSGHHPYDAKRDEWKKDKDSERYKKYFKKISESMIRVHEENPHTSEHYELIAIKRLQFMKDNPEVVSQWVKKISETKQKQKESGELRGENHYLNKMTIEQRYEVYKKRKDTYNNMTEDQLNEISKNISDGIKRCWASKTAEERSLIGKIHSEVLLNLPPERKAEISKKMSDRRKKEMELLGVSDIFKPSYNIHTIPYIENVLNQKYNTKFIHAESPTGEFRIYDKENKQTYYADAYCPKLNLWIEFDEPNKFSNGILKENHVIRELRIKNCLPNITIVRIYFDKNNI